MLPDTHLHVTSCSPMLVILSIHDLENEILANLRYGQ
jgi:hypothetical protein